MVRGTRGRSRQGSSSWIDSLRACGGDRNRSATSADGKIHGNNILNSPAAYFVAQSRPILLMAFESASMRLYPTPDLRFVDMAKAKPSGPLQ